MTNDPSDGARRTVLRIAAGLAAASQIAPPAASAAAIRPAPTGKPGDFDFLTGRWKIRNRRKREGAYDEFEGEATVYRILAGVASVEELRIPARNFSGMGLRLLDVENKLWADYWVNGKNGVLTPPPSWGSFSNGIGTWDAEDEDGGKPIIARGVWDRITPTSCRWYQAVSSDGGKSWEETWSMDWLRV